MVFLTTDSLPRWLTGKEPTCQCRRHRDMGSIPGSGRSLRRGHSNPIQYSCLENPTDRGVWWVTVHGVTKSQTQLSMRMRAHTHSLSLSHTHSHRVSGRQTISKSHYSGKKQGLDLKFFQPPTSFHLSQFNLFHERKLGPHEKRPGRERQTPTVSV